MTQSAENDAGLTAAWTATSKRLAPLLAPWGGLHSCAGCGVELDGDDPHDRCEDCFIPPEKG